MVIFVIDELADRAGIRDNRKWFIAIINMVQL